MDTLILTRVITKLEAMTTADEPPTAEELTELLVDLEEVQSEISDLHDQMDDKQQEIDDLEERIYELRSTRIRSVITLLSALGGGLDCSGCNKNCHSIDNAVPKFCPNCGGKASNGGADAKSHLMVKAQYYRNHTPIQGHVNSVYPRHTWNT